MKPKALKPKARFIRSVVSAARECDTIMPWARKAPQTSAEVLHSLRRA